MRVFNLAKGDYRVVMRIERGASLDVWGAAHVLLDGTAPASIDVPLRNGVAVSGRLEFLGAPLDALARREFRPALLSEAGTAYGTLLDGRRAFVDADGAFSFLSVPPGRYLLDLWRDDFPEWRLESARLHDVDVADVPFTVGAEADVMGIEATVVNVTSQISGTATDGREPLPHVDLVFSATDPRSLRPSSRRIAITRTDASGHYVVRGLPPGEYNAGIIPAAVADPVADPSGLADLRVLATVRLARGEKRKLNISIRP